MRKRFWRDFRKVAAKLVGLLLPCGVGLGLTVGEAVVNFLRQDKAQTRASHLNTMLVSKRKCEDMLDKYCDHVRRCVAGEPEQADEADQGAGEGDGGLGSNSECRKAIGRLGWTCSYVVEVSPTYKACMDAIDGLTCGAFGSDRGPPPECHESFLRDTRGTLTFDKPDQHRWPERSSK